jgi:hypothetical protein
MQILSGDMSQVRIEDDDMACNHKGGVLVQWKNKVYPACDQKCDVLVKWQDNVYRLTSEFSATQPEIYQGGAELVGEASEFRDQSWLPWRDYMKVMD